MTKATLFTTATQNGAIGFVGLANEVNVFDLTNIKGTVLTWTGGSASHAFSLPGIGLVSTSVVTLVQKSAGNAVTILSYAVTTDTITVTWTADPGAVVLNGTIVIAP